MAYKTLLLWVCVVRLSAPAGGRPLRKRTVSEVQFMHDLGEHRQVQERREWLQMRLRGLDTASRGLDAASRGLHTAGGGLHTATWPRDGSGEEAAEGRMRSRLEVGDLSKLRDFTPEEIQQALNLLEKLLQSKQS